MIIGVDYLKVGMVVKKSIFNENGCLLLGEGSVLTESYINRIKELGITAVVIKHEHIKEAEVDNIICEDTRIQAMTTVYEAFEKARITGDIDIQKISDVAKVMVEEAIKNKSILISLADIRSYDDYTFTHCVNVAVLSVLIGQSKGYSEEKLMHLAIGGMLHDIGKTQVPIEILNKPDKLSDEEFEIMKKHTEYGFEELRKVHDISILVAHIAYQHHEKYDGSGYPRGLKGDTIHEYGRIVAVADVYDALISNRSYRQGMTVNKAYEIMCALRESHLDPSIVDEFFEFVAIYPVGTIIQLNTGEVAIVTKVLAKAKNKPIVRLVMDKNGVLLKEAVKLNLERSKDRYISKVYTGEEVCELIGLNKMEM